LATTTTNAADLEHMRAALLLAERGLGRVWPNPAVGCVIVDRAGHVVGRGWTQPGGRPHAETEALEMAGDEAHGATAYVTLEPCSHHGKTPPCADALIAAGINRCVVALQDPYPEVNGRGLRWLQDAGVAVELGLLGEEAADLNGGFLTHVATGRPMVTLKLATSLDGRIATRSGQSKWITGETARAHGHRLRVTHDAIMIGSGTAVADDPALTSRLPGLEGRSPLRIVMDRRLRLPVESKLVQSAPDHRTVLITRAGHPASALERYRGRDVEVIEADTLDAALAALGGLGVTRLLVEGGATLAATLVRADRVDRLHWFRAAGIIGGDGLASIGEIGLDAVSGMTRFERTGLGSAGGDTVETYRRKP
jgi:diaminohydroxyphosphoribosylaminopyrimidine deaminase / 5-amino-6-(5-phosphoribosylamino)uracil reductase